MKTRLQLQTNKRYKGILDAFSRIIKEEGWLALYRGILPALFLTSHGAVQFVVYEKLKEMRPPSTTRGRSEKRWSMAACRNWPLRPRRILIKS